MKKILLFVFILSISIGVSQDIIYTTTLYDDDRRSHIGEQRRHRQLQR